ncbi:nitroreductase/quinone reductase family protein [Amycolatopsis anabasis]|uniref:nitroreductase/quinone reductase family protein n=1 Tax=Amycolatopsis anabasis TaxID=1840409 RepID=UPI00131C8855|nr:nitroreductase/quinone reductase family protein [Amycolatopsis anabasis]
MSEGFDFNAFQRQVIAEFRANGGRVGGMFEGSTLALLTTTGARTGLSRTSPLAYLHIDGKAVVVASAMGAPTHPAWYHNIRKNPVVTVETGTETYTAIAEIPTGNERDALFDEVTAQDPGFAEYQTKTTRKIPVVTLHRADSHSGPAPVAVEPQPDTTGDRVTGLGDFLVESHDWLRHELGELRRQLDALAEGRADSATLERPSPDLAQQLRTHCLEFCGALEQHHTGEDQGAFPMLAQQYPELAEDLTKLGEEHKTVARLRRRIQQLVDDYVPGESDPSTIRDELEHLAAKLETHFEYEEKTVVNALNSLGPAPTRP